MDDAPIDEAVEQRRDTKILELVAEHFVSHTLGRYGILCAKPYFDQIGADLLGIMELDGIAKFCRIQCKGRTVKENNSSVCIPIEYVDSDFAAFLFVEDGKLEESKLYCFFADDFRNWSPLPKDGPINYVLYLKKNGAFRDDLREYEFEEDRANRLKVLIENVDIRKAFSYLRAVIRSYPDMTITQKTNHWRTDPRNGTLMRSKPLPSQPEE